MLKTTILLAVVVTLTLATACQNGPSSKLPPDYTNMNIAQLQKLLRNGKLTSVQLVNSYISRAHARRQLRAYTYVDERGALQRAEALDDMRARGELMGPLHGIPIVLKDNIHVTRMPNSAGTPALKNYMPAEDGDVVLALRQAGAVILGKTNMHELALGVTGNNATFGAVANPRAAEKFAGCGSAAVVAAGLATAALGTDTRGSVRVSAALTGISALRPSMGRYSQRGVTPVSKTLDTPAAMAKSVADLAVLDAILAAEKNIPKKALLKKLRLGVPRAYFYQNLDVQTQLITERALDRLRNAGVTLVQVDIPDLAVLLENSSLPIALYEVARDLQTYLTENKTGVSYQQVVSSVESPDVRAVFASIAGVNAISKEAYMQAMMMRKQLQASYQTYFSYNNLDAMVFPTTPLPARSIEGSSEFVELNGAQVPTFATYTKHTDPASIAGIPGLTLPVGETYNGLPVGLEIDGPNGSDGRLLAIGLALEELFQ